MPRKNYPDCGNLYVFTGKFYVQVDIMLRKNYPDCGEDLYVFTGDVRSIYLKKFGA